MQLIDQVAPVIASLLDEHFVEAFALAGTPAEYCAQLVARGDAGVTELALTFSGIDAATQMTLLAVLAS
jgi:hypothetical protein